MAESAGKFITLEGGEGAGKSTQIACLRDRLVDVGVIAHATREPGGSPGGEKIRKLLVTGATDAWDAITEALLHFAARRQHLVETVWPMLNTGKWVISDRFADSTLAYQGYAQGLGRAPIDRLYEVVVGDFRPDLTLILDIDPQTGLERTEARHQAAAGSKEDRYERMGLEFHEALRDAYRRIAEEEPERCVLIDANRALETVQDDIWAAVAERFGFEE